MDVNTVAGRLLFQWIVSIPWAFVIFLRGYFKSSILYTDDGLRLVISVCSSWEMALKLGPDLSFDNM
jgi:hypothetical protein